MIVGYLIMGSYWLVLTNHYNRKVIKTLERLEEDKVGQQKSFPKIRPSRCGNPVANAIDNLKNRIKGNYALVLEGGDNVVIQGIQKEQEAGILFRFSTYEEHLSRKPPNELDQ